MTDEIDRQNAEILRAYKLCFSSPSGQIVLADLVAFCRGAETCFVPGDQPATNMLEGRREVFLRIQQRANLTYEEILQLRLGRIRPKTGDE